MKYDKKALIEGLKELIRVSILAAAGAAILWLQNKLGGFEPTSLQFVIGTALLRAADKFVHKSKNIALKGLSPV